MRPGNAHAPGLPDKPYTRIVRDMVKRQEASARERPERTKR